MIGRVDTKGTRYTITDDSDLIDERVVRCIKRIGVIVQVSMTE